MTAQPSLQVLNCWRLSILLYINGYAVLLHVFCASMITCRQSPIRARQKLLFPGTFHFLGPSDVDGVASHHSNAQLVVTY